MKCLKCGNEIERDDIVYKVTKGKLLDKDCYVPTLPDYDQFYIEHAICEKCMLELEGGET